MRLALSLLLLITLPISIDARGGRGGGGRGRVSGARGKSRGGGGWGYGQHKSKQARLDGMHSGYYGGGGGFGNKVGMMGGSGGSGQTYIRKTPSSMYRSGAGSTHTSAIAKTSIALAAYPLATRVFGNNVIREREHPLKVDGRSYYWSASYVPQTNASATCVVTVDANDPLFSNITFTNLEKVTEIAWACAASSYCCGLACCYGGYEGVPLGTVGTIGVGLLTITSLLIPGVALVKGLKLAANLKSVSRRESRRDETPATNNEAARSASPLVPQPDSSRATQMEEMRQFFAPKPTIAE